MSADGDHARRSSSAGFQWLKWLTIELIGWVEMMRL